MYDIEDDFDFGYVPTVMSGSRSGSMKKMTKKQPKTVPKQPLLSNKSKPKEQFDDLLDGLSLQDSKKIIKPVEKKPVSKNSFDDIESYFDEPKSISLDKTKQVTMKQTAPTNSFLKTQVFKGNASDQIINEDKLSGRLGKTELTLQNSNKEEEVPFVSNRNMKPPLKKKDNVSSNVAWSMGNMALTIPEEEKSIISSKKQDDDEIIRPPPRLMSKRSIESKMDKKDDQPLLLVNASKSSSPFPNDGQFESKKEKKEDLFQGYNRTASLTLDEPKDQKKYAGQFMYEPEKKVNNYEPEKKFNSYQPEKKFNNYEPQKKVNKVIQKVQSKIQPSRGTTGLNLNIEHSYTMPKDSSYQINQSQSISGDWQKQIEQMKYNFQKQVDFLQQNLDKQITINRETREKIIYDSNKMIEQQRQRTNKMHQEQIKRMKDLFEWQKTRMEQTYKVEIDSLRQSLELANKNNGYGYKTQHKEDTSYLQMQLKTQKRVVNDREKILEQREREFEQRQIEMNRHRKQEQQRLRGQQKRLMEQQTKWKKQVMVDKKLLADEKQQAAIQIATLELEAIKKRERAEINLKQNSINHESIQNERNELRLMNVELMRKHKAQIQDLESQKQQVRNLQQELIKRLRVLEVKNREVSVLSNTNNKSRPKKENNWLTGNQFNTRVPAQKQNEHDKSMANIARTKDRFHQLEGSNRLNVSLPDSGKFNLQTYMMTMQQYNNLKSDL